MFRRASRADLPQLKALWRAAFGDSDEEISAFFDSRFDGCDAFLCEQSGAVCAALYALRCTCCKASARYIYAVATDEKMRGRGLASGLMRFALASLGSEGVRVTWLCPANERLRGFYERFGYRSVTSSCTASVRVGQPREADFRVIAPDEAARLRSRLLCGKSAVDWDESALEYARKYYSGEWLAVGGGLVLATKDGEAVEVLGVDKSAAADACAAFSGKTLIRLRLPFWAGGEAAPQMMLRSPESEAVSAVYAALELN